MNLGKLLAAGKSIMNGRGNISYRASKQIYLPKFESAKNPFKPEPESAQVAPSPLETVKPAAAASMPRATRAAIPEATRVVVTEAPVAAPVKAVNPVTATKVPVFSLATEKKKSHWADKLNPSMIFRRTADEAKPLAKGAKSPAATQAELTLDSIKVVHNDLSDVDVEIVPIKSRSVAPETAPPKKSWEFVGERLFGVEAT